jgi:hypothetical protein
MTMRDADPCRDVLLPRTHRSIPAKPDTGSSSLAAITRQPHAETLLTSICDFRSLTDGRVYLHNRRPEHLLARVGAAAIIFQAQ